MIREKDISVSKLAEQSGISSSNLYSLLRAETTPTLYTLYMLCEGFGITLSGFFLGMDETEEGGVDIIREMKIEDKLMQLTSKNRYIMEQITDILLKSQ